MDFWDYGIKWHEYKGYVFGEIGFQNENQGGNSYKIPSEGRKVSSGAGLINL